MAYLNDPIFPHKFYYEDRDFTWDQIPKKMLLVDPKIGSWEVKNLAKDILGWTIAAKRECTIIMMHEPASETLQDLYEEWRERRISSSLRCLPTEKVVLVGGEPSLMYYLINALKKEDYIVFTCTTERVSEEVELEDGSTKKVSVFKHVRLRQL